MKSIEYLYGLVGQSNFTTIGYTHQDEKLKDELISRLPNFRLKELSSSFSFNNIKQEIKQKVRENRLDCLLDNTEEFIDIPKFDYLVVDLEDISPSGKDDGYVSMHRSIQLKNLLENLRSDSIKNDYKVIFTSSTYKTISDDRISRELHDSTEQLKGGSSGMYMADLALMIKDGIAKITKNRFGYNDETISLNVL
jgi:hypothetical protein